MAQNTFLDNAAILGLFFVIIALMYTVFKDVLDSSSYKIVLPNPIMALFASVCVAFAGVLIVMWMSNKSQNN